MKTRVSTVSSCLRAFASSCLFNFPFPKPNGKLSVLKICYIKMRLPWFTWKAHDFHINLQLIIITT